MTHKPSSISPEAKESGLSGLAVPELLAPAGDWLCARAAVENGADAIYFGLDRFNARMRAENFTEADLAPLMEFLHGRGVKGYVTLNTLVFQNELAEATQYLHTMIAAGVDAVIVQDVGICRVIRQLSPDFPIHASTQMTVTSAEGVAFAKALGCNLVVLARECSLREIEQMQRTLPGQPAAKRPAEENPLPAQPPAATGLPLPIEVFVHGALCVAYSGQCLTSEALGGRSANRGECAQACRMPYELISDGRTVPLGNRHYLLSPQDLSGLQVLPELVRLGVASLKIEGRLKSPEYVANVTRVYRRALDTLAEDSNRPIDGIVGESRYDLEMAFSRGLYTGWFGGVNNQELVHAHFGKKRGVYLGEVERVDPDRIVLMLEAPLKPGDGIVFDAGAPDKKEEGGRVYSVQTRGRVTVLTFGQGDIDFRRVQAGVKLWKTSDPELEGRLRQTFSNEKPLFRRPIDIEVHGAVGTALTVIARDEIGHVVQVTSSIPLAQADAQPLTTERLRQQLGRLGGTPFHLRELANRLEGEAILPVSELNRLRRDWVLQLEQLRSQPKRWTLTQTTDPMPVASARPEVPGQLQLAVLVRNRAQFEAALQCEVDTVYCEFEDPKKYREVLQHFRQWQAQTPARAPRGQLFVAPPRIFKTGEDWILKQVRSCDADGYLVRNYDHLKYFADCRCIGDYSLNIANAVSAEYFKQHYRLERLTASYDLNAVQLEALLSAAPPAWFEITIHQHVPMFHMEHCVFCAFLSQGTDYSNCGRPCDHHEVQLRDRVGAEHPVKADAGCRNTVFNARAQTGAEHVAKMLRLGVRHFRLEFLNETPERLVQTVQQYRKLLSGEISGSTLWRELKLLNQLGVTRGPGERTAPAPRPVR